MSIAAAAPMSAPIRLAAAAALLCVALATSAVLAGRTAPWSIGLPVAACLASVATWLAAARARRLLSRRASRPACDGDALLEQLRDQESHVARLVGERTAALRSELAALGESRASALAASAAKGNLLANVSYEIRTPMNGILGLTELVLDTSLTEAQRHYLEMVRTSAEELLSVISEVLDHSNLEAGRVEPCSEPFSLRELLGSTVRMLSARAHAKNLELLLRVARDVPDRLVGDAARLRQILLNLCGNAVKFTDEGEVEVAVEAVPGGGPAPLLRIQVRDTGVGIPAERRESVFQAYALAERSTARRFGGTGLGLTLARRYVELLGGRLVLESAEGAGSTFHFTIPLPVQPGEALRLEVPAKLSGTEVLVVDDNDSWRSLLASALREEGASVVECRSVEDALVAGEAAFQVAVIDAAMPGRGGAWLALELGRRLGPRGPRAILLASPGPVGAESSTVGDAIPLTLRKPAGPWELVAAIAEVERERRPPGTAPPRSSRSPEGARRGRRRVLVAEDNRVNQALAVALLERAGHAVVVADNGQEAVDLLASQPFDIILMDCQMPIMDGFRATRAIRKRESGTGRRVPIVAVTACAMRGDRELCVEAGMDAYVTKPVGAENLERVMTELLSSGRLDASGNAGWGEFEPEEEPAELLRRLRCAVEAADVADVTAASRALAARLTAMPAGPGGALPPLLEVAVEMGDALEAERLLCEIEAEVAALAGAGSAPREIVRCES